MSGTKVQSPCVGVCEFEDSTKQDIERICRGCRRTDEQIEEWFFASEERKKEILADVLARSLDI
jgi:predicted Fe-S protein YdhL (DUF1289 family)